MKSSVYSMGWKVILTFLALVLLAALPNAAVQRASAAQQGQRVPWVHPDGTTHSYEAVAVPAGITWTEANAALQGYVIKYDDDPGSNGHGYTIEQTLSDEAQRNTIAFDGLAFLSGSLGADSFLPPGKVADFWGFQYLRDNDPSQMGHNTDFLTRAANNVLYVLTDSQVEELVALAEGQVDAINQYAYDRFVLIRAFRRLLEGDLPEGTSGLDHDAVKAYSAELYRLDGEISFQRAEVMGGILHSLTADQLAYLDAMVGQGMTSWPDVGDQLDPRDYDHDVHVAVMTYAGDLFSWYAGSVEADVYFCPERQGTYFGSFYLKDAPAMGNPDYTIDPNLTANMGSAFLAALTADQAQQVTALVDTQRNDLYEIVDTREQVATELRRFMDGDSPDSGTALSLMERYGELDGEIVYNYATTFAQVGHSLSSDQEATLASLRADAGVSEPVGAYLYSEPIEMPEIADTDFLFAANTTSLTYPIVDTGQTTCYNNSAAITCPQSGEAFYGQDAQFDGNQPSYTLSADGLTVYDNVTGLTWTQSPDLDGDGDIDVDDKLTFAEAQTYADTTLNPQSYGGYSDWRLPSMKELYSLMDFSGTDPSGPNPSNLTPFIDTDYFDFGSGDEAAGERLIDAQFWSSNAYVGTVFVNQPATFGLNLADGRIKGYPSGTTGPMTKLNYVYFVRGNTDYGVNDFNDNGDGTVTDNATGLTWSQDDSGDGVNTGPRSGMNWEDALAWVQQKNDENYLGYSDWRLPNAKEMQNILDYSRAPDATGSAAIDPVFNTTQITNEGGQVDYPWFWTGTTHVRSNGGGEAGAYICFGRATGYMGGSWIDVHGAGAQRSDQKSGDFTGLTYVPDGYYFGQAPQGDATRSYNYVRLVRDAGQSSLPGDVNGDCAVDIVDIMLVAARWGAHAGDANYDPYYDLDHDGDIDIVDIVEVAAHWGEMCD
jgi:Spy/CpxP family protein refolding chaperone